jgi:hypothetical protein
MAEVPLKSGLVDLAACMAAIWPDERSRPKVRWFLEQKKRGLIPYKKITRRVFYDSAEVRAALDRVCSVGGGVGK